MVNQQINTIGIWAWFVPLLVLSSGLFIGGYAILDEIVLIITIIVGSYKIEKSSERIGKLVNLHYVAFNILMFYFILQAIRGVVIYYHDDDIFEALRKLRWVIFFVSILVFNVIMYSSKTQHTNDKLVILTVIAGLAYFLFYIGYGEVVQRIYGLNRYQLQFAQSGHLLAIWTTTAYAMYPMVVVLPAIFICIKEMKTEYHKYAYVTLLAVLYASLYYESRSGVILAVAFLLLVLLIIQKEKAALILLIFTVMLFLHIYLNSSANIMDTLDDLLASGESLWSFGQDNAVKKDLDRTIHIFASINSIGESVPAFLFGYGYAVSGKVIGYHYYDLAVAFKGFKFGGDLRNFATEFIPAILVDCGVVGLLLLSLNVLLPIMTIILDKNCNNKLLLTFILCVAFLWGFVINIHDAVLFYCIIMPKGIIYRLASIGPKNEAPCGKPQGI